MGFHPTAREHPSGGRLGVSSENSGFSSHSESPKCPPVGGGGRRPTAGRLREFPTGGGGLLLLVVLHGLGQPPLDLLDPSRLGRVRRQPFRRALALRGLLHALPE